MSYLVGTIYSNESEEWYSPVAFVDAARHVLGKITLDPASCEKANQVVRAEHIYTVEDDGLSRSWSVDGLPSKVWHNPPYGRAGTDRQRGQTEIWLAKLLREIDAGNVDEAIVLVNAHTYKEWFRRVVQSREPLVCFTERLAFWNEHNQRGRSPHGSAILYFGPHERKFIDVFSVFGPVMKVMRPSEQATEQLSLW